jgi:hypothetical protein
MGENGGQFFGLHVIAVDSKGNIYKGEAFAGERPEVRRGSVRYATSPLVVFADSLDFGGRMQRLRFRRRIPAEVGN